MAGQGKAEGGDAHGRGGRRRRRKRVGARGGGADLQDVERLIAEAVRKSFGEAFGFGQALSRPVPLRLDMVVEPGPHWRLRADPPLSQQILAAVRETGARAEAHRRGRVYCYRCESAECLHSLPPTPTAVFGGYTPTGLPRWPELTQLLLDLRHPGVDLLFEAQGLAWVAACMGPERLKSAQLDVFGRSSKAYDILGQVVVGFLRARDPEPTRDDTGRVALTIQAVESRRLDGSPRLDLNILGPPGGGASPLGILHHGPHHGRVADLIAQASRRIQQLAPQPPRGGGVREGKGMPSVVAERALGVLRELARGLERIGRQSGRRTAHVVRERRGDQRPTSKARDDAEAATEERVLWDERRGTFIVLGPRNRVHVFSPQGRHVTSLLLEGDAVEGRLRRRRWRRLKGQAVEQFRAALARGEEGGRPGPRVTHGRGGTGGDGTRVTHGEGEGHAESRGGQGEPPDLVPGPGGVGGLSGGRAGGVHDPQRRHELHRPRRPGSNGGVRHR